jgi:hypothetical protein
MSVARGIVHDHCGLCLPNYRSRVWCVLSEAKRNPLAVTDCEVTSVDMVPILFLAGKSKHHHLTIHWDRIGNGVLCILDNVIFLLSPRERYVEYY